MYTDAPKRTGVQRRFLNPGDQAGEISSDLVPGPRQKGVNDNVGHPDGPAAAMTTPLSFLYMGELSGTCLDRANALRRLGHQVDHIDVRKLLPRTPWVDKVTHKLGGDWFAPWILRSLPDKLNGKVYEVCYVDGGEWITPSVIRLLRRYAAKVVNYNIDDPLGSRDGARSRAYRQSLPYYDLCVVMRPQNIAEALARGAKAVIRINRSADEISHAPVPLTPVDHLLWDADVLFIGTWFPERGSFLLELVERGIPLAIRGARWEKAPEWPKLRAHWRGGPIHGSDYAKAIQCAKVTLGMLSKGNRDLHTTRSMEIPALGGLLCAERTSEHTDMYEEGKEALFWIDSKECASQCLLALSDDGLRLRVAQAGRARIQRNGDYNEKVMRKIVQEVHSMLSEELVRNL